MTKAYDIRVYGRVFNVGFRRYVHRYGQQCNLLGFVENDYGGDCLHIEAEGDEEDLKRFTLLVGEGTPFSYVTDMKIEVVMPTNKYTEFQQIR